MEALQKLFTIFILELLNCGPIFKENLLIFLEYPFIDFQVLLTIMRIESREISPFIEGLFHDVGDSTIS